MGGADAATGHQQILHLRRVQAAVGDGIPAARLQVAVIGGAAVGRMDVDGVAAHGHGVLKHAVAQQILRRQPVRADDLPALPHADAGAGGDQPRLFKAGDVFLHEGHDLVRLPAALHLRRRQVEGIHGAAADDAGHVQYELARRVGLKAQHHVPVHVELATLLRQPDLRIRALNAGSRNLLQAVERRGGEHVLPILAHVVHHPLPVHAADLHVHGHRLRQVVALPAVHKGHARMGGQVGVRRRVDEYLRGHVEEALLGVQMHRLHPALPHVAAGVHRVVQQRHAGLQRHLLQHQLQPLRVEGRDRAGVAHEVLHVSRGKAARLKPLHDLLRDAAHHLHAPRVKRHHRARARHRQHAAEAAVLLHQQRSRAAPGAGNGRRRARRAAADDHHVVLPHLFHGSVLPHGFLPRFYTGPPALSSPDSGAFRAKYCLNSVASRESPREIRIFPFAQNCAIISSLRQADHQSMPSFP